jgi:RNA polymerase sigma factor (sigma-70 family)
MIERMNIREKDIGPTRYSLLSRLQDWRDDDSWKDFYETYSRLILAVALKSGLTRAEADDVLQETVICVAKEIKAFRRNRDSGSFKAWLRKITKRRIVDQKRKRDQLTQGEAESDAAPQPEELEEVPEQTNAEIESLWESQWKLNLFQAALAKVKRQVKEEHFQIFDLYAIRGWPAARISRVFNITITQIYIIKYRVGSMIRKHTKLLEKKHF